MGNSTLDDLLVEIAAGAGPHGRCPTPSPRRAITYRSDHFEFAKQGVPALDPKGAGNTSASPPTSASENRTNTRPRTITRSATR